jgi:hypothetical protein
MNTRTRNGAIFWSGLALVVAFVYWLDTKEAEKQFLVDCVRLMTYDVAIRDGHYLTDLHGDYDFRVEQQNGVDMVKAMTAPYDYEVRCYKSEPQNGLTMIHIERRESNEDLTSQWVPVQDRK